MVEYKFMKKLEINLKYRATMKNGYLYIELALDFQ